MFTGVFFALVDGFGIQEVIGQEPSATGREAAVDSGAEHSDKLDKLLNLVDKDIAQLSQVKVGGGAGSPSLDTQVSTVSRQESTIGKTPYAVFVITNEMIRRSGAKTIPDVLRMAPGVEVAQIDSNKWAISIRGINWRFTNHLLVQIDGRMVYTPLFGCVFWDVQDLLLEDVERIEVIRGPGASIWGANAVNGIINIITKNAKNTQGAYVESGTGTEELGFSSVRYGGGNGDDFHYRFFGKWFERGPGFLPDMIAADDWRQARGGFRMDWEPGNDDAFTFQGQYYNGYSGSLAILPQFSDPYYQMVTNDEHVSGEDVILHWKHRIDEQSDWAAMVYYDRTERHWLKYNMGENRDTFVADWQHRFPLGERHEVIWGVNYRTTRGEAQDSTFFGMIPPERSDYFLSYFAQDQITLVEDRWYLTLGSKFENNSFTGFEYQPTVRVLWTPDHKRSIWGAVSRAVRIPSWAEVNGYALLAPIQTDPVVVYPFIMGNPLMISEELIAYECGYREQTTERFSWDLALYLFDYRHIGTVQFDYPIPGPDFWIMPGMFANKLIGQTYGFEWTGNYRVTPHWTLRGNYTFMILTFNPVPGSKTPEAYEGESPRNQFYLQSSWDLGRNWELDLTGRYVDSLPYEEVPSYFAADLRLAWRPRKNFEWSVVGRNLLAGAHPEYGNDLYFGTIRTEVQEEVYTQLIFRH